MKLRTKASLLMALVVAAALTTTEFFFDRVLESSIRNSIYDGLEGVSSAVSDSVSNFIQETLTDSRAVAANIPPDALEGRQVAAVERYLAKMSAIYPKFQNGMFILDAQGYLWADYPVKPKTRGKRFNFREYYKRTMAEKAGIVGTPYRSARTGQPVLTFTALLKSRQGEILGLLGCSVQLLSPHALGGIRAEKIGRSGYVYVYDDTRLMILHPSDDRVLKREVPPGANRLFDAALTGWEGVGETVNSRGVSMLLSLRRIPGTNWIVGAQQPKDEAFKPMAASRLRALLGTCLGVLIAIVLVILAMRHITNPLERLRQATLELGSQGAEESLADIKTHDEIGDLAESFRGMSLKLHDSMESMKKVGLEWKLTFDSVRDAICLLDNQRRMVRLNHAAESLLRVTQDSAVGTTFEQSLAEAGWWVQDQNRRLPLDPSLDADSEVVITNGELYFKLVSTYLNGNSGQDGGCIITARDITQRVLTVREKERLQFQLLQAQKMEALGTLAGGIAHDFNNILGSIMGNSELALDKARQGQTAQEMLEQILKSSERAKALVQQILTFSRRAEPHFKTLDLNQALARTVPIIKSTFPKMITVEVACAPDLQPVSGDATQIEQVILNLASNAKDAMPDGGKLILETRNLAREGGPAPGHPQASDGQTVQLIVSDSGEGMDQETLEHIFEPFYTTKQVGKGTGLGLATVYGIVQSHHGQITCQTEPGAGTTFMISLPAAASSQPPDEVGPSDAEMVLQGDETILLVDDEEPLREIGRLGLERHGYHILTAQDGEEAISIYGEKQDAIGLVILDISMPGMGGFKCLQRLLAINPQVKVIIASGYAHDLQARHNGGTDAAGYLAKPYRMADLLKTVRAVLDA